MLELLVRFRADQHLPEVTKLENGRGVIPSQEVFIIYKDLVGQEFR